MNQSGDFDHMTDAAENLDLVAKQVDDVPKNDCCRNSHVGEEKECLDTHECWKRHVVTVDTVKVCVTCCYTNSTASDQVCCQLASHRSS